MEEYDFGVTDRTTSYPVVKFDFDFSRATSYYVRPRFHWRRSPTLLYLTGDTSHAVHGFCL